jgi:hypothetical protein
MGAAGGAVLVGAAGALVAPGAGGGWVGTGAGVGVAFGAQAARIPAADAAPASFRNSRRFRVPLFFDIIFSPLEYTFLRFLGKRFPQYYRTKPIQCQVGNRKSWKMYHFVRREDPPDLGDRASGSLPARRCILERRDQEVGMTDRHMS